MRPHKSLIVLVLFHVLPAAAEERIEHLSFRIHHQLWGDIGTLSETIAANGSGTTTDRGSIPTTTKRSTASCVTARATGSTDSR